MPVTKQTAGNSLLEQQHGPGPTYNLKIGNIKRKKITVKQ